IPIRRPGPIHDASARPRQARYLTHFGIAQFKIEQREILFETLDPACARNDDDALLDQPAKADLRCSLPVRFADPLEQLVTFCAAPWEGAVGDDRHSMLATRPDHLVLIEKRMALDLIADQWLGRNPVCFIEERHGEIRNADLPRVALALHLGHGAECLRERHARIWPMDQQKVDHIQTQFGQTFLDGTFEIMRSEQRGLHLGRDHNLRTKTGGFHPFPYLAFIVVHLRRIDMPIADADGLFGQSRTVASSQRPCAEANDRNTETFGLDRWRKFARGRTHYGVSHFGACGGLTTRMFVALSFLSSAISESESLKS